jgi:hypothetical protein
MSKVTDLDSEVAVEIAKTQSAAIIQPAPPVERERCKACGLPILPDGAFSHMDYRLCKGGCGNQAAMKLRAYTGRDPSARRRR